MKDETGLNACKNFDILCDALDEKGWKYQKDVENLHIECGVQGDDLPMELHINVDEEMSLVILLSMIPLAVGEDKRIDTAVAVSAINNKLVDGSFDFNVSTGKLFFRLTNSFFDSQLSKELFNYMIDLSCAMIDEYNDKFLMLSKNLMSLEDFMKNI